MSHLRENHLSLRHADRAHVKRTVMHLRSPHLALALFGVACGGCALTEGDAEPAQSVEVRAVASTASAFVLTVTASFESDIDVTNSTSGNSCPAGSTCNFAYLQGTTVTVQTAATNLIDCARFSQWNGACAGQGATCSLVINSDLSTSARYKFGIPGCVPL
jgi:hypothetical protein